MIGAKWSGRDTILEVTEKPEFGRRTGGARRLEAAEKLQPRAAWEGHDFSRAVKPLMMSALAAEVSY
jgi:hypothetical protein